MKNIHLLFFMFLISSLLQAANWPGHAIVGNGRFCAVYSEDSRITLKDGNKGVRHFYFQDYASDYFKSAHYELFSKQAAVFKDSIQPFMADFYTPSARHYRAKTALFTTSVRACQQGLLMQFKPGEKYEKLTAVFKVVFNETLPGRQHKVTHISLDDPEGPYIQWSDSVRIRFIGSSPCKAVLKGENLIEFMVTAESNTAFDMLIIPEITGTSQKFVTRNAWNNASKYWNEWSRKGGLPFPKASTDEQKNYNDYYSRNLYAAYACCLNGQVPADVTGQFLTNEMPQLYPRDAMMVAMNMLEAGYYETATEIIRFWSSDEIPHKSPGEFYARYDAFGQATDAGSGARYDEPEWDAGAYLIILNYEYHKAKGKWITNPDKIYQMADFIISAIDSTGLLYEGGIVEWTGYLPATNMLCAAGLKRAAEIAEMSRFTDLSSKYQTAFSELETNITRLFDSNRKLYAALRYHGIKADNNFSISEKKGSLHYLWDVTSVFGVLWGFPDHNLMQDTYQYIKNNLNHNGGVRYFEATDNNWLQAYGNDLFFFATAAWAKYAAMQNDRDFTKKSIDWMIAQSNIYGLMPERILADYSQTSEASPLSWGCAEFSIAVKRASHLLRD